VQKDHFFNVDRYYRYVMNEDLTLMVSLIFTKKNGRVMGSPFNGRPQDCRWPDPRNLWCATVPKRDREQNEKEIHLFRACPVRHRLVFGNGGLACFWPNNAKIQQPSANLAHGIKSACKNRKSN